MKPARRTRILEFRTVRAWTITLCAAAIVFVLLAFLSAFESRAPVRAVPAGPDGEAVSDTYMFVHRTMVGDGTLTARVASLSGAYTSTSLSPASGSVLSQSSKVQPGLQLQPGLAPWAKAGLILEPDTSQGTAYAAVMVTGSRGVQMQYNYIHDSPGLGGAVTPSPPRWLRLTRVGSYPYLPSASTWRQPSADAFTVSGSGDIAPLVGDIISAQWAGASVVNGTIAGLLILIVLSAVFTTSEYRRGLIHITLAASPRRGRALAAKAAAAGGLAFATGDPPCLTPAPTRATTDGRAYLDLQNLARRQGRPTDELLLLTISNAAVYWLQPRVRSYSRRGPLTSLIAAPVSHIPFWYHFGMSTQIAVRLPDDMVKFVDQLVETGRGSSRAAVITRALDRERRHEMAVQDAAIYAESGEDPDMTDLVRYLSGHPADPDQ